MYKTLLILSVYVLMLLNVSSSSASEVNELMISAAASLRNVMESCGRIFESSNPGKKVNFNFASSGVLAQQILSWAPVDIFFAADIKDFDRFKKEPGILVEGFPVEFLRNSLCFAVAKDVKSSIKSIEELSQPEWQKIAIGNPKTVPAGRYAEQALKNFSIYDKIQDRLIFCENVRQVLDYVVRGEVDGGFVFLTDVKTVNQTSVKEIIKIDEEKHGPIIYGLGRISHGMNPALAEKFLEFIRQPECEKIFIEAGFELNKSTGE